MAAKLRPRSQFARISVAERPLVGKQVERRNVKNIVDSKKPLLRNCTLLIKNIYFNRLVVVRIWVREQ